LVVRFYTFTNGECFETLMGVRGRGVPRYAQRSWRKK